MGKRDTSTSDAEIAGSAGKPRSNIKKRRSNRRPKGFFASKRYIHCIHSKINEDGGMGDRTLRVVEDIVDHMIRKLCAESKRICTKEGAKTCAAKHVEAASHIVLPFSIAKHSSTFVMSTMKQFEESMPQEPDIALE